MELKYIQVYHIDNLLKLLIVPYGIEMRFCAVSFFACFAFNRTLWN